MFFFLFQVLKVFLNAKYQSYLTNQASTKTVRILWICGILSLYCNVQYLKIYLDKPILLLSDGHYPLPISNFRCEKFSTLTEIISHRYLSQVMYNVITCYKSRLNICRPSSVTCRLPILAHRASPGTHHPSCVTRHLSFGALPPSPIINSS